jgi:hypothetical protein
MMMDHGIHSTQQPPTAAVEQRGNVRRWGRFPFYFGFFYLASSAIFSQCHLLTCAVSCRQRLRLPVPADHPSHLPCSHSSLFSFKLLNEEVRPKNGD